VTSIRHSRLLKCLDSNTTYTGGIRAVNFQRRMVKILERAETMADVLPRRTAVGKRYASNVWPCNVVLLPSRNAFPWIVRSARNMIRFKQIEFFDHTGSEKEQFGTPLFGGPYLQHNRPKSSPQSIQRHTSRPSTVSQYIRRAGVLIRPKN
jgi:hypothetical protein